MPLEVDAELLEYMGRASGAIHIEVRSGDDPERVLAGLRQARAEIFTVRHPEEPADPLPSFASSVVPGPRGATFLFDVADAEIYEGLLERLLHLIVAALEEAGVGGLLSWPEGAGERMMSTTERQRLLEVAEQATVQYEGERNRPGRSEGWEPGPGPAAANWSAIRRDLEKRGLTDLSLIPDPALMDDIVAESPGWSTRSPLPSPRGGLGGVRGPDGRIYAIGGTGKTSLKTVEAYDPATDQWKRRAALGAARRGPGIACGNDGRIYAIGGFPESGPRTTVEAYDIDTNRWEPVAPMKGRALNDMAAATGADGRIYAMALSAGIGPNVLEAYDAGLDEWTSLSPAPGKYSGVQLVAVADGRILALVTYETHLVEAYDPRNDRWTKLGPLPRPRWLFAAAVHPDGRVYVIGGTAGTGPLSAVDTYDSTRDRWVPMSRLPIPRRSMAAVTGLDRSIFVFGGSGGRFGEEELIDRLDVFNP